MTGPAMPYNSLEGGEALGRDALIVDGIYPVSGIIEGT